MASGVDVLPGLPQPSPDRQGQRQRDRERGYLRERQRRRQRETERGYLSEPADPVWSTSPYDRVGGWADADKLHTEPGGSAGWAAQVLDESGGPVRECRTATPGAVVALGLHFDMATGIDALDRLSVPADGSATTLTAGSLHAFTPQVSAADLHTTMASRLAARTFSPWKSVEPTVSDESEPEPELPIDSVYKMRRFRPASKNVAPRTVFVSLAGTDSSDGSFRDPVQTINRARELMKSQGATLLMRIREDGELSILIDGDAVPQIPSSEMDENARDPFSPESPCFLSKFPECAAESPPLREMPAKKLDSTIKNLELQSTRDQSLVVPERAPELLSNKPLANWRPPRCVSSQLLDTQAVLSSSPATPVVPLTSSLDSTMADRDGWSDPSRAVPSPPSTVKSSCIGGTSRPASRSRVVYQPIVAEKVGMVREAAVVAQMTALDAAIKGRSAVVGIRMAVDAEVRRDMRLYAEWASRGNDKTVSIRPEYIPRPAKGIKLADLRGKTMSVGVAVAKDGSTRTVPLQRHALEMAMADELPQRMSAADGLVPPSAYAVLYWNGTLIGQTHAVPSQRSPRWRYTFELAHIKTEEEEGCNFLDVEVWALPATSDPRSPRDTPSPPVSPRSGVSKLGGSKKLLGKATLKSKPGEFPEGLHVLALRPQKTAFFRPLPRPPHISAPLESVEPGASTEEDTRPVTSGPRLTIKLIERPAVHTIRKETMKQHEDAKKEFKTAIETMMQHIQDARADRARKDAQMRAERLFEAYISEVVDEIARGATRNAVVERKHQQKLARWRANVGRAVQEVMQKSIEWTAMQLVLGLNAANEPRAHSAATRVQAVQRGKIGRKQAARTRAQQIEQSLGLLGTEEEAAHIAKIQAVARGKIARQELAEQQTAATKIAAAQRGQVGRRRVAEIRRTVGT